MTPLLSVRDLTIAYARKGESVTALNGISFDLAPQERLAFIGESGSGKSTLALTLGNLLPAGTQQSGTVTWPGFDGSPQNGKDIGFVFQDPFGSLDPVWRVGDQIAEIARTHLNLTPTSAKHRALDLIGRVALPDPAAIAIAYPHQLSGGQRQRIAIACAIAARPRLLIADEPTSALDTMVQAEIAALILDLVRVEQLSLIFITHDIALASNICGRIAVLRNGLMVEIGPSHEIVSDPNQQYTRELIGAHVGLDWPARTNRSDTRQVSGQ